MAIFKEYLTLSDFEKAKKPFDEKNDTYYINEDDEATVGDPDFKWNQIVFCKEGKFFMTRRTKYAQERDYIYIIDLSYESAVNIFEKNTSDSIDNFCLCKLTIPINGEEPFTYQPSTDHNVKITDHTEILKIFNNIIKYNDPLYIVFGGGEYFGRVNIDRKYYNKGAFILSYINNFNTINDDNTVSTKYTVTLKYNESTNKFIIASDAKKKTFNNSNTVYLLESNITTEPYSGLFTKISGDTLDDLYINKITLSNGLLTEADGLWNNYNSEKISTHSKIKKILDDVTSGTQLYIDTSDPSSEIYIPVMVEHRIITDDNIEYYLSITDNMNYSDGTSIKYCIGIKYNSSTKKFELINGVARQTITWEVLGYEYYLSCYEIPDTITYCNGDFVCLCSGYKKNQITNKYKKLTKDDIISKYDSLFTNIPTTLSKYSFLTNSTLDGRFFDVVSTDYADYNANDSDANYWYYWIETPSLPINTYIYSLGTTKVEFDGITSKNSSNGIENPSAYFNVQNYCWIDKTYTPVQSNKWQYSYWISVADYYLQLYFGYIGKSYNSWGTSMFSTTKDPFPSSLSGNELQLYISTDGRVKVITASGESIRTEPLFPDRDTDDYTVGFPGTKFELWRFHDSCKLRITVNDTTYEYSATIPYTVPHTIDDINKISYISCQYGDNWVMNTNNNTMSNFTTKPFILDSIAKYKS